MINLRGSVLPVIDTRIKFGMTPTEYTLNTYRGDGYRDGRRLDTWLPLVDLAYELRSTTRDICPR